MFCDLYDKYGKDFNWYLLPLTQADGAFVVELNKEIGQGHFLSGKKIRAVAKCDSNDDVLYVVRSGIGRDIYYMFHLTYSAHNADGFPRYVAPERRAQVIIFQLVPDSAPSWHSDRLLSAVAAGKVNFPID